MRATKDSVSSTRSSRAQYKFGAGRLPASLYITKQGREEHFFVLRFVAGKLRSLPRGEGKGKGYTFSAYATTAPLSIDDDHFKDWQPIDNPFILGCTTKIKSLGTRNIQL